MAITQSISGWQQTTTGITTWDTLFDTTTDFASSGATELPDIAHHIGGIYIEAQVFDVYVRLTPGHLKPDGTYFVDDTDAGGIRIPAGGLGQFFYGNIQKVEVQAQAAGAKVTWYPVVT